MQGDDRGRVFHHKAQNLNQIIDCMASSVNSQTVGTSSSQFRRPDNMQPSKYSLSSFTSPQPPPRNLLPKQQQPSPVLDNTFSSMMNNLNLAAAAQAVAASQQIQHPLYQLLPPTNNRQASFQSISLPQGQVLLLPTNHLVLNSPSTSRSSNHGLLTTTTPSNTTYSPITIKPKNGLERFQAVLASPNDGSQPIRRGRGRPRLNETSERRVQASTDPKRITPLPIRPKLSNSTSPVMIKTQQPVSQPDKKELAVKEPDVIIENYIKSDETLLERNKSDKPNPAVLTHLVDDYLLKESAVPFEQLDEQELNDKPNVCLFCGRSSNRNENFCNNQCAELFEKRRLNLNRNQSTAIKSDKSLINPHKKHKTEQGVEVRGRGRPPGSTKERQTQEVVKSFTKLSNYSFPDGDPTEWSCDQVYQFVCIVADASVAQVFKNQDLDGAALSLIKDDHLVNTLQIKLGPALKIMSKFNELRRVFNSRPPL